VYVQPSLGSATEKGIGEKLVKALILGVSQENYNQVTG
jgi:hypothetical protein